MNCVQWSTDAKAFLAICKIGGLRQIEILEWIFLCVNYIAQEGPEDTPLTQALKNTLVREYFHF